METSKELIKELRRVAYDMTRETTLYSVAELLKAAANTLEEDDCIIKHLREQNDDLRKVIQIGGMDK